MRNSILQLPYARYKINLAFTRWNLRSYLARSKRVFENILETYDAYQVKGLFLLFCNQWGPRVENKEIGFANQGKRNWYVWGLIELGCGQQLLSCIFIWIIYKICAFFSNKIERLDTYSQLEEWEQNWGNRNFCSPLESILKNLQISGKVCNFSKKSARRFEVLSNFRHFRQIVQWNI